jgi:hypothetical protein
MWSFKFFCLIITFILVSSIKMVSANDNTDDSWNQEPEKTLPPIQVIVSKSNEEGTETKFYKVPNLTKEALSEKLKEVSEKGDDIQEYAETLYAKASKNPKNLIKVVAKEDTEDPYESSENTSESSWFWHHHHHYYNNYHNYYPYYGGYWNSYISYRSWNWFPISAYYYAYNYNPYFYGYGYGYMPYGIFWC